MIGIRYATLAVLVMALGMSGCAGQHRHPDGESRQSERKSNTTRFTVQRAPREAALGIVVALERFGFSFNTFVQQPEDAVVSDYFSARTNVSTASGKQLSAHCDWLADGETAVTITSDLPAEQHEFVMQKIRQAVEN